MGEGSQSGGNPHACRRGRGAQEVPSSLKVAGIPKCRPLEDRVRLLLQPDWKHHPQSGNWLLTCPGRLFPSLITRQKARCQVSGAMVLRLEVRGVQWRQRAAALGRSWAGAGRGILGGDKAAWWQDCEAVLPEVAPAVRRHQPWDTWGSEVTHTERRLRPWGYMDSEATQALRRSGIRGVAGSEVSGLWGDWALRWLDSEQIWALRQCRPWDYWALR